MKSYFITIAFALFFIPIFSQPKIEIKDWKKNFGFVKRGDIVELIYEIKNLGTMPLLVFEAEVECSCTTVEFNREPVLPDQFTKVKIIFNTQSVYGRQDRYVYLKTNSKEKQNKLRYKGIVLNAK